MPVIKDVIDSFLYLSDLALLFIKSPPILYYLPLGAFALYKFFRFFLLNL